MATAEPTTHKDRVYSCLRQDICGGAVAPGTKLVSIEKLAKRFNVSAFPVYEALSRLEEEGYLTKRHGSGTYVEEHPGALTLEQTVALCLATNGHVYGDLTAMLVDQLHSQGRSVLTVDTDHDQGHTMLRRALFSEARVFVIHGDRYFPFAALDHPASRRKCLIGVLRWETSRDLDRVHRFLVDHEQGGRLVARHLASGGHRHVLVAGPESMLADVAATAGRPGAGAHARAQAGVGFAEEWQALGGRYTTFVSHHDDRTDEFACDESALLGCLAGPDAPTAVFGLRDVDARDLRCTLLRRAPTCVAQLAWMGYGDTPWSQTAYPPFSSVNWNLEAIAVLTCRLIEELSRGGEPGTPRTELVRPKLVIRPNGDGGAR